MGVPTKNLSHFKATRFTPAGLSESWRGAFVPTGDAYANAGMKITFVMEAANGAGEQKSVDFKAFITDYNESFSSEWKTESVYGRIDPIGIFSQTKRTCTLSFKIPASTTGEGFENMYRVDMLRSFLYPSYTRTDRNHVITLSQNPLVRIRVMNLLTDGKRTAPYQAFFGGAPGQTAGLDYSKRRGVLCAVRNMNVSFNLENGEVGVFESGPGSTSRPIPGVTETHRITPPSQTQGMGIVPKLIEVNMTFDVIHEMFIGWDAETNGAPGVYGCDFENSTMGGGGAGIAEKGTSGQGGSTKVAVPTKTTPKTSGDPSTGGPKPPAEKPKPSVTKTADGASSTSKVIKNIPTAQDPTGTKPAYCQGSAGSSSTGRKQREKKRWRWGTPITEDYSWRWGVIGIEKPPTRIILDSRSEPLDKTRIDDAGHHYTMTQVYAEWSPDEWEEWAVTDYHESRWPVKVIEWQMETDPSSKNYGEYRIAHEKCRMMRMSTIMEQYGPDVPRYASDASIVMDNGERPMSMYIAGTQPAQDYPWQMPETPTVVPNIIRSHMHGRSLDEEDAIRRMYYTGWGDDWYDIPEHSGWNRDAPTSFGPTDNPEIYREVMSYGDPDDETRTGAEVPADPAPGAYGSLRHSHDHGEDSDSTAASDPESSRVRSLIPPSGLPVGDGQSAEDLAAIMAYGQWDPNQVAKRQRTAAAADVRGESEGTNLRWDGTQKQWRQRCRESGLKNCYGPRAHKKMQRSGAKTTAEWNAKGSGDLTESVDGAGIDVIREDM